MLVSNETVLEIFKSLGDKTRLDIVRALYQKSLCLEEMSERFGLTPATLSHHMKKLEEAGLVSRKRDQYFTNFSLIPEAYEKRLSELIFGKKDNGNEDKFTQKVIHTFMREGKITQFPRQHKKRLVLLSEIIKRFKPNRVYKEPEVDAILERLYPDYCTLRRMLIDERFMERENGEYKLMELLNPEVLDEQPEKSENTLSKDRKITLKREYKEKKTLMGIYKIENLANRKLYIGASNNVPSMFNRHQFGLKIGSHENKELQNDWNEYGKDNFVFELLDKYKPKDNPAINHRKELEKLKEKWLEELQPFDDKGYNKKTIKKTL